ncbi:MAG: WhiB family transcriptional regulator [Kribbellaceae bacterium]
MTPDYLCRRRIARSPGGDDDHQHSRHVPNRTRKAVREHELPCRASDPELWFAESPADVELAKRLCVDCPVRAECLAGALERREPWGVWGGELLLHGVVIPRKRPRGRPRKSEAAT